MWCAGTVCGLVLWLAVCSVAVAGQAGEAAKRPRDRYQKPIPLDKQATEQAIAAVRRYKEILETGDYDKFYRECAHPSLRQRETAVAFAKQIATVADKLKQFFADILAAHEQGLQEKGDFQVGQMPYPVVKDTVMIQFADRIDDEAAPRWPKGRPLRIQMAPEDGVLKFYDID